MAAAQRADQHRRRRDLSYHGIGYSIHAGQVSVTEGIEAAARHLERVPTIDPGMGVE